jgi:uncharacterized membrane protein (UPF0127 family)
MLPRRLQGLPSRTLEDGLVVHEAASLRARLLGLALLPRGAVPPGHALLIPDCRSVHTFGMRFPIDLVFLDERGRALRVERAVKPRRMRVCRAAFAVLERPSPPRRLGVPGEESEP